MKGFCIDVNFHLKLKEWLGFINLERSLTIYHIYLTSEETADIHLNGLKIMLQK